MAHALDEERANRPADDAARHDADHRRGHRERGGAGHSGFLKERREREAGRRASGERDDSRQHAHQRILSERDRHQAAEHVLQRGDDGRDDEENDDEKSAAYRSATLAPNPTEAKNAFCSGVCSVVSNFSGWIPEK